MLILLASRSMLPAFPLSFVVAVIFTPSAIVRSVVSISIWPALPAPVVSTEILPSPVILMLSWELSDMLPPVPLDVVVAVISILSLIVRFGVRISI